MIRTQKNGVAEGHRSADYKPSPWGAPMIATNHRTRHNVNTNHTLRSSQSRALLMLKLRARMNM